MLLPYLFLQPAPLVNRTGITLQQSRGFLSEEPADPKTIDPAVGDGCSLNPSARIRAYTTGQDSKSINSIIRRALMLRKRKLTLDKNGGNYANYL